MRWRILLLLVVLCWPGWAQPLAYLWRFSRAPEGTVLDSQRFYTVAEQQLWAGRLVDGKVLWKKPLHNLAYGPVLDQGRLLFISDGSLQAVDAASGASLWKQKAQTFALSGGQLWCSQPKISRLDPQTGQVLLQLAAEGAVQTSQPLIVTTAHDMRRLDEGSGNTVWTRKQRPTGVLRLDGQMIATLGDRIERIDLASGRTLWTRKQNVYRPLRWLDGQLVGDSYGGSFALDPLSGRLLGGHKTPEAAWASGPDGWAIGGSGWLYRHQKKIRQLPFKVNSSYQANPESFRCGPRQVSILGTTLVGWGGDQARPSVQLLSTPRLDLSNPGWLAPGRHHLTLYGDNLDVVQLHLQTGGKELWSRRLNGDPVRSFGQTFEVVLPGPGTYQLIAQSRGRESRQTLTVSRYGVVCKYTAQQVDVFLYDFMTSKPAPNIQVDLLTQPVQTVRSDAGGVAHFRLDRPLAQLTKVRIGTLEQQLRFEKPPTLGQIYLRSDRPLYRPGHKIDFYALTLKDNEGSRSIAAGQPLTAELRDPSDNLLQTLPLSSDDKGMAAGSFALSEEAPLGRYRISASCPGLACDQSLPLEVQAYRKPPFELKMSLSQPLILQEQNLSLELSSQYFFGGPVAQAKVHIKVSASELWDEPGASDDSERDSGVSSWYQRPVWEGDVVTDARGYARLLIPTTQGRTDEQYTIVASAVGAEGQTVEASTTAVASLAEYGIYLQPVGWVHNQGNQVPVRVRTVDRLGRAHSVPVELIWDRQSLRGHTDGQGQLVIQWPARRSGYVQLKARSRDSGGRLCSDSAGVWILGSKETADWAWPNLELIPGRKKVPPGSNLDLLVLSSRKGTLWLTVESHKVLWQKVLQLHKKATRVSIPVAPEWSGQLFIHGLMPNSEDPVNSSVQVKLTGQPGKLQVKLSQDKADYRPGKVATLQVQTSVPAALVVSLVDDALYKLRAEFAPNLYNAVHTSTHQVEQVTMMPRKGQAAGFQTIEAPLQVRSEFKDTAFWKVGLLTDEQGHAQVPIELPDNLTRWRGIVQGVSWPNGALQVGQAQTTLVTKLPLMVRTIVPRFAVEGDRFEARGVVTNQLQQAAEVHTQLQDQPGPVLQIKEKQSQTFAQPIAVGAYDGQPLQVTARVKAQDEADAERKEVPVLPFGPRVQQALSFLSDVPLDFSAEVPDQARQARLEVRLAPGLLHVVESSLDYLADYPYGCAEQTMSRFGPTLTAVEAAKKLGLKIHKPVDAMVAAGLQKLYGYQHSDGGWGWWTYDATHPYMTGYVLAGLAQAQKAGYAVEKDVLQRGVACTQRLLEEETDAEVRAYLSWSLSSAGQTPPLQDDSSLTFYGQALLLQAAGLQGQWPLAQHIAERLGQHASTTPRTPHLLNLQGPDSPPSLHWETATLSSHGFVNDDLEATCQVLRGLLAVNPKDPRVLAGLRWVLEGRRGKAWKSSKDTAQVVYLLSNFLEAGQPAAPGLTIDDQAVPLEAGGEQLRVVPLQPGQKVRLHISPNTGYCSGSVQLRYVEADSTALSAQSDTQFEVQRSYFRGKQRLTPPISLQAQEQITVELNIHCKQNCEYVMLQDYRAAGMEAVTSQETPWWAQREDRDDRTVFFFTSLRAGDHKIRYTQRAETCGQFRVLPAQLELMYQPDSHSRSASDALEIRP